LAPRKLVKEKQTLYLVSQMPNTLLKHIGRNAGGDHNTAPTETVKGKFQLVFIHAVPTRPK
jgi:hypothetical protein